MWPRVIVALADGPATVVGHALGTVCSNGGDETSRCRRKCGPVGLRRARPPAAEVTAVMTTVFDPSLDPAAHLDAVAWVFFAPGNDPSPWGGGWHVATAIAEVGATAGTPVEDWWMAGSADVLVIQPGADVAAVPENADQDR